jgi:hypothetical protein
MWPSLVLPSDSSSGKSLLGADGKLTTQVDVMADKRLALLGDLDRTADWESFRHRIQSAQLAISTARADYNEAGSHGYVIFPVFSLILITGSHSAPHVSSHGPSLLL